jgi:hypothetical protein
MCRADTVVPNGFTANGARGSFFARTANRYLFVEEVDWAEDARVRRNYEPGAKVRCSQASIRQLRSCAGLQSPSIVSRDWEHGRPATSSLQRYLFSAWRNPDVLPGLKASKEGAIPSSAILSWEQVVSYHLARTTGIVGKVWEAEPSVRITSVDRRIEEEVRRCTYRECRVEPDMGRSCSTRIPDQ